VAATKRKLLVLDTTFTLEMIRARGLEHTITCRDLDGFFEHVWSVHPFATLLTSDEWAAREGKPLVYPIDAHHTVIEGRVGRSPKLRRMFPLNFLASQIELFRMLKRLIEEEGISVIRTGSPLYIGLFAMALSRTTKVPFVIRVGGNHDKVYATTGRPMEPRLMRSRRLEKLVERFVFPRADLVAGANQDNLNFAIASGARPERATLFRYGNLLDARHFVAPEERELDEAPIEALGLRPRRFLIYIGRLQAVKRVQDVVRVVDLLRKRGHDIDGLLVGDGEMRDDLKRLAEELGLDAHIVLAGNRPQEFLANAVSLAAVVVSPHTGRALSEAALAGVPIAAYDIDWQSELIETNATGALVPDRDVDALANAVERYLVDPEHARKMGAGVRARALAMLDPEALDAHEREQYELVISRAEP
jgi:glycosyltransferase involved in cell wall biosynthesis